MNICSISKDDLKAMILLESLSELKTKGFVRVATDYIGVTRQWNIC